VNNAGAIPGGDLQGVNEETWRKAWDLKVFGYVNLTRAVYASMKKKKRGVIVNILGNAGERLNPAYIAGSNYPIFYEGRNSDGRTDFFNQLDLFAGYEFRIGSGSQRISISANVINLLGTSVTTNKYPTELQPGTSIDVTEDQFFHGVNTQALIAAQGLARDPRFLQAYGVQVPRQLRLGLKFSF